MIIDWHFDWFFMLFEIIWFDFFEIIWCLFDDYSISIVLIICWLFDDGAKKLTARPCLGKLTSTIRK